MKVTDHGTGQYEIRVEGHLDAHWVAWFDGLSLTNESDGTTVIRCQVVDQAALHGLLRKVRDVALPLVSVTPVEPDQPQGAPHHSRTGQDMTTIYRPTATKRAPMSSLRKTSLVAGALYLLTFVSIPTLALYSGVHDPNFMTGSASDTPIVIGTILEIIVALAGIGTAIVLHPVVKRQNEAVALGFVGARVLEASAIFAGVVSLLTIVHLRQDGAGAEALTTAQALVAQYDAFFLGQGLLPVANALLLGSLLYRSRLVPRILPVLGFIGAPLLLSALIGTMFGINDSQSTWSGLTVIPIALWEFSLGVYLVVKGFKPSPITAGMTDAATPRVSDASL